MFFFACSQISMEALVNLVIFSGFGQACQRMFKVLQNNKATKSLFICCMQLHVHGYIVIMLFQLGMLWHAESSLKQQFNHQYLWKWLCNFVNFLHLVFCIAICILLDIHGSYKNMLFLVGITRHRLSANQIVKCFKLKKLKKDMRYQVGFLLQLKLEEILCYFGL